MLRGMRVGIAVALALLADVSAGSGSAPAAGAGQVAPAVDQLSVMSYNVHGLPWPLAVRGGAFDAIASRLRELRAQGRQPHVMVLQEAFTPAAKAIGAAAGYRYVRFGPAVDTPAVAGTAADGTFQADARRSRGEADGKWVDSGLAIFSDYPIVAARRVAYPVCAGFDCLANKGALAVKIAVPGVAQPIYVVGSHLNARKAAGVAAERTAYAYRRQVDLFENFIRAVVPADAPLFVAGDFNVGKTDERRATFAAHLLSSTLALAPALGRCERLADCAVADRADATESARRNKDWLLFRPGAALAVTPVQFQAPFGRAADGSLLSDHIGIAAAYRLGVAIQAK